MPARFPKRRPDGSFCVEVALRIDTTEPDVLAQRVNSWLGQWVQENRYWKNALAKDASRPLDFFDDFAESPTCAVSTTDTLALRLKGRPEAKKWWKDWLIMQLLKELQTAFGEIISVERITNCPEVQRGYESRDTR